MRTGDAEDPDRSSVESWAASGAMALTGRAGAPALGPPEPLVPRLRAVAALLGRRSAELGRPVTLDPLRLLGERAAIAGLRRQGQVSCGGNARLLRTGDGWLAVSLARPEDVELVPAWLGVDHRFGGAEVWDVVTEVVRARDLRGLVDQAVLLGLPVGALPAGRPERARHRPTDAPADEPFRAVRVADGLPAAGPLDDLVVADLSALWAGPLCGSLLAAAGAHVIKVESTRRPDGARRGPTGFFDLLNAGKQSVALDLSAESGRGALRRLLERAHVVIDASRPRALEQLGIDARRLLATGRPRAWVSITAHGRAGVDRNRVGFGDDAAVAGGLVVWEEGEPCFCADAVADPTTAVVAATAALGALATGASWLLDVSLAGVARHLAGPTLPVPDGVRADAPSARAPAGAGPALGAHTADVLDRLGIAP
jgi:hypothetical protein